MKKIFLFHVLLLIISTNAISQNTSAKEKANNLAKNEFSKTKYKKMEKYGVVKEMKKEIISTPVINNNPSFYNGNYVYQDLNYKLEIRTDKDNKPLATLSIAGGKNILLKNVSITDAFFSAIKPNTDGTQETWEGAFINKSDDGNIEFGLGIKLSRPIQITEGLQMTKIFLKKVSP